MKQLSMPSQGILKSFLGNFFGSKESLRRKIVVGSQWLFIKSMFQGVAGLIKAAIFARILYPYDFGLMALAVMAIGLLESLSTTGIEIMIQRDGDDYQERLPAYWTIKFIRGLILTAFAWLAAIPLAHYYQKPELISLVRFLGFSFLFNGLAGFGKEVRQRRMEFGQVALAESLASLAVLLIGLGILFWARNVWALAAYTVLDAFFLMIASYVLFPWRPNIRFDPSIFKGVAVFGGSIILLQIMNYLFSNFDKGVIGKLLGVEQLGYYARAYFLALLPVYYFSNIIALVILPAFQKVSDDPHRFKLAFKKTLLVFALMSGTMGVLFFAFSEYIILLLYGEKWLPVLPIFKILIIYGVSKGIVTAAPPLFFVKGKPWLVTITTAVMLGFFGILCLPMTYAFNAIGTSWAVVISASISHGLALIIAFRLLSQKPHKMIRAQVKV